MRYKHTRGHLFMRHRRIWCRYIRKGAQNEQRGIKPPTRSSKNLRGSHSQSQCWFFSSSSRIGGYLRGCYEGVVIDHRFIYFYFFCFTSLAPYQKSLILLSRVGPSASPRLFYPAVQSAQDDNFVRHFRHSAPKENIVAACIAVGAAAMTGKYAIDVRVCKFLYLLWSRCGYDREIIKILWW